MCVCLWKKERQRKREGFWRKGTLRFGKSEKVKELFSVHNLQNITSLIFKVDSMLGGMWGRHRLAKIDHPQNKMVSLQSGVPCFPSLSFAVRSCHKSETSHIAYPINLVKSHLSKWVGFEKFWVCSYILHLCFQSRAAWKWGQEWWAMGGVEVECIEWVKTNCYSASFLEGMGTFLARKMCLIL